MAARGEPQHCVLGEQPLGRREPAEARALVGVVERELELAAAARFAAALRIGREPQPHLPQQLAPREPEAVAPAHPHQVLDRAALEPGWSAIDRKSTRLNSSHGYISYAVFCLKKKKKKNKTGKTQIDNRLDNVTHRVV